MQTGNDANADIPFQSTFNPPPEVNWLNAHSNQFGFPRLHCRRDQCTLKRLKIMSPKLTQGTHTSTHDQMCEMVR